jgi:hypothetical protein
MRKLILAATILAISGVAPALARGGHGHRHHHSMHRQATQAPSSPAADPSKNATMPAPGKQDPEDAKLDQRIKSICRGC